MERTKGKLRVCTALLALNVLFIWGNSLLPASLSGAFSGWVRTLLATLLPILPDDPAAGHGLLRKLAHFTEFACLGSLLAWMFSMLRKSAGLALPGGLLVAAADETIQRFVPGRGPSLTDVLIDTCGTALGMILLLIGYTVYKKTANRALEDPT